jgi:hypothetical protein
MANGVGVCRFGRRLFRQAVGSAPGGLSRPRRRLIRAVVVVKASYHLLSPQAALSLQWNQAAPQALRPREALPGAHPLPPQTPL